MKLKNKLRHNILALIVIMFLIPFYSNGQSNTSSPYSKFGIGDLASVAYGRNLALGGTGYGLRDMYFINLKNPAAVTAVDSMNFLFEMGVNVKTTRSDAVEHDEKYWNGNLTHIVASHRINRSLMASYGLMPYTNIGYRLRTMKVVEGDETFALTDWEGSGGINKLFLNLGLKLSEKFSLGGEFAYYYGPVTESRKTWTLKQSSNPSFYHTSTKYKGASFKLGGQLNIPINTNGSNLNIGGAFSTGQRLWGKSEILIQQQYGSSAIDSIYYYEDNATSVFSPMSYGVGFGLTLKGKYLLAGDIEMADWRTVNDDKAYIPQTIYSLGFEILPANKQSYFSRCSYRFGYRYDSGYIQTKGYDIDDIRFSVGLGLPIQKSASMINVSFEAGQRGTEKLGLVRERYSQLTVAFSLQDFWFIPRKVN